MIRNFSIILAGVFTLVLGFLIFQNTTFATLGNISNSNDTSALHFDRSAIKVNFLKDALEAKVVLVNPQKITIQGNLSVSLVDPNGKALTSSSQSVTINNSMENNFKFNLPTTLNRNALMYHRLQYSFRYNTGKDEKCGPNRKCGPKAKKIEGIKSIYSCVDHLSVRLLAQNKFMSGAPAAFRLVAFNPADGSSVQNADVKVLLVNKSSNIESNLYTGKTNNDGTVNASFQMPEDKEGNFDLKVTVAANIPEQVTEEIIQPINIKRNYKILLSTDKPIYQPNQTIKIRALALNTGSLKAIAKKDAILEVYDAKGNKVFKKKTTTNEFGIISTDFILADEVNMGNYKIKAIVDDIDSEKTVQVSRYVLPKYKVVFKTDKDYYLPTETVKGSVDINYFFGKPVKDADVKIKIDKFDIGFSTIQEIKGITDNNGHFDFEATLPESFVGQKIAEGNALVKFDIAVKDTADHIEKKTSSVLVSEQPINIVVIPESGSLAKNITNNIYIMTTYPDGSPVSSNIIANVNNNEYKIKSDSTGIATFEFKPDNDSVDVKVFATDLKGNKAEKTVNLASDQTEQSLLLRTDKAITKVGGTVKLQVIATKPKGTVYIDMIKNDQTVLTKSMDLNAGKAEMALDVTPELVGTVGINAYIIDKSSEIIRDSKIIYVNPAEELTIAIKANKQTYKPAEEAVINFKVTDNNNHPILAALGVYVVDESVFALSELQPGLEKIFFTLEEEILKPRFEIHGLTPSEIVKPAEDKAELAKNQQQAAKVLFAAAKDLIDYPVKVDTYKDTLREQVDQYNNTLYNMVNNITSAFYKYQNKHNKHLKITDGIATLISEGFLREDELIDPWGNKIAIIPYSNNSDNYYYYFYTISKGPDGIAGTVDDIAMTEWRGYALAIDLENPSAMELAFKGSSSDIKKLQGILENVHYSSEGLGGMDFEDGRVKDFAVAEANAPRFAGQMAMPMAAVPMKESKMLLNKTKSNEMLGSGSADKKEEVRVREYFPETLYANPSVITDVNGNASITIPMADSITTWRLTTMANSIDGLLGSNTSGIRVFQDFFIDIDLPVALTQNDKVSIPIAIYNYLPTKQTIKLEMQKEDWYESLDTFNKEVELEPNQVSVEYFTIEVKKLGQHTLTVYAFGSKMNDAIKRQVRVEPDGEEFRDAISGHLENNVTQVVDIPENAINDASRILVKIYPGYLSQVVEGLDKIFRMPSGCFEQTSSTTYPNVLVLDYMKRTKQLSPEIQMKAESYINSGYQRLLTFEVNGGGFDWFGSAPANKVLTAYGLMEFYDMSTVHEVDPNLISRTQNWLANQQEKDGSWKPDAGGIAEGAINKYQGDTLRTTAYIGWALASSNYDGPVLNNAVTYVKNNLDNAKDPYTCAVIANLMVLVDPDDAITQKVFNNLLKLKKETADVVYWEQTEKTPMYGEGQSANIETTALASIALINYGKEIATTNKALNYLVKSKDTFGTWYSTQATILSMKALLMSLSDATTKINATITVSANGKEIETYKVDETNSDVLKQIDLKTLTQKGDNKITLSINGQGSLLYQIVKIYYIPWELLEKPKMPVLSINVDYDKTTLEKNDMATAIVNVQNNTKDTANMVIVDLGIPPGFEVQTADLDKMVSDKMITKYSIAARQIILYFEKIKPSEKLEFRYQLKAKIAIKAKSGKSKIYKYYEPEVNSTSEPVEIQVN